MKSPLLLATLTLGLLVTGCSKLTADNYARIKVGMAYAEVTAIIGNPASCSDIAGFKACRWGDDKSNVTVRFVGDKVVLHSAENIK